MLFLPSRLLCMSLSSSLSSDRCVFFFISLCPYFSHISMALKSVFPTRSKKSQEYAKNHVYGTCTTPVIHAKYVSMFFFDVPPRISEYFGKILYFHSLRAQTDPEYNWYSNNNNIYHMQSTSTIDLPVNSSSQDEQQQQHQESDGESTKK